MENENFKHLKPESYYNDLYDRFTIEKCRRWEEKGISKDWTKIKDKTKKSKINKVKKGFTVEVLIPTALYFIKGECYAQKSETIRKWIDRDGALDEKFENTAPPQDISCLSCRSEMITTMKDLHTDILDDKKNRVLFFFECSKCKKRRGVWEDGEKWKLEITCSKCKSEAVKESNKRKGNIITTIYACPTCGYKEKDTWDLDEKPKPEKIDPNFEKDRKRFCLSGEEGSKYVESKTRLENFSKFLKETEGREEIKKKIAHIKKLNIAELKKLLAAPLKKEEYINLDFTKPEIGRDIIINFTVQDNKTDRGEYDSRIQLQRLIKRTLENTNWILMSEGINYRLGILTGRLKGYEKEEDLLRLLKHD